MRRFVTLILALTPTLTLSAADIKLTPTGVEVTGVPKDALAKLKAAKLAATSTAT